MSKREPSLAAPPSARGQGPRTPEPATGRHRTVAAGEAPNGAAGNATEAGSGPAPAISSPDMIVREVVQGLYKGSYVPGQRLVEADLTKRWNVSRGTIREALNRLSAEGIVTLSHHRGAAIRVLNRKEMHDILEVLELMIGMAARLAAKRIGESDNRERFTGVFEALQAFRDRPASFELIRARNRFYRTLAAIGGNRELQDMLGRVHVHLVRVQLQALHEDLIADRFEDYDRVGEAVLSGDMRRAELAARRHVRNTSAVLNQVADG